MISPWRSESRGETGSTTPGSRKQRVASPLIGCRGTCFAVAVLAAARTFMQIAPRAGWAFGFMHSVLVGEFASVESTRLFSLAFPHTLSLSLSLLSFSRPPVVRPFYFYLLLATYTCEYAYEPPRNARQYRPICIRDASLQALSKFPFPPHTNQPLSGRARSLSRWPCLPVEVAGGETEEVACGSTKSIVCAKVTGTLGIKFVYNLG